MLRARISIAMWILLGVAIPLFGVLSIYVGLILIPGWGKLMGVLVLMFFLLFVQTALGFGTVGIDEEALEARCLLGRYRIRWDEIEQMWRDGSELNLTLEGHGKRVAVAGYSLWKSPDKQAMVEIMTRNLKERGIEPRVSTLKTLLISNRAAKVTS